MNAAHAGVLLLPIQFNINVKCTYNNVITMCLLIIFHENLGNYNH